MNRLEQLKARRANLGREIERTRADRDYSEGVKARRVAPLYRPSTAERERVLDELYRRRQRRGPRARGEGLRGPREAWGGQGPSWR
jgi:hypothetical protein